MTVFRVPTYRKETAENRAAYYLVNEDKTGLYEYSCEGDR